MSRPVVHRARILLVLSVAAAMSLVVAVGDTARAAPTRLAPKEDKAVRRQARAHFLTGRKRFALRQFRSALMAFKKAYALLPLSGFLFNIGQCHRFLGDCKMAIFYYSGFVRANPGTPDAKFVNNLMQRCKAQLAGERVRRAEADRLYSAGRTALTLGQHVEAIKKLTAAYRKLPLPGYLFHLGEAHQGVKQYERAVHFYRQYLRFNPGTPQVKIVRKRIAECKRLHAVRIHQNLGLGGSKTPRKKSKPVYKRWWFWTSIAVAVVATAVGLGVGLGLPEQQKLPRGDLDRIDWSNLSLTGGAR